MCLRFLFWLILALVGFSSLLCWLRYFFSSSWLQRKLYKSSKVGRMREREDFHHMEFDSQIINGKEFGNAPTGETFVERLWGTLALLSGGWFRTFSLFLLLLRPTYPTVVHIWKRLENRFKSQSFWKRTRNFIASSYFKWIIMNHLSSSQCTFLHRFPFFLMKKNRRGRLELPLEKRGPVPLQFH